MLVSIQTSGPQPLQICFHPGEVGIPLGSFGTSDSEIASLLHRDDGRTISRKTVRAWRQEKSPIPGWALSQLTNIFWRKVILNNDLNSGRPNPEVTLVAEPGQEGNLLSPLYWNRVRRDGKPMFTPGSAAIVAAKKLAWMSWSGLVYGKQGRGTAARPLRGSIVLFNGD